MAYITLSSYKDYESPMALPQISDSNSRFQNESGIIVNVATLQAASNFGASQSLRPLAWALESRSFGPKTRVLEKTTPISGMSQNNTYKHLTSNKQRTLHLLTDYPYYSDEPKFGLF